MAALGYLPTKILSEGIRAGATKSMRKVFREKTSGTLHKGG